MTPLVYDATAKMEIDEGCAGTVVASENPAGAEINATGKVVYGYNLRVQAAGSVHDHVHRAQCHLHRLRCGHLS